jgi:hypothetical protein
MISPNFKKIFKQQIDSMFGVNGLSLSCKLIGKDRKKTQCPNCIIDPISGKSSGRYKSGGDINFTYGQLCPICNGVGFNYQTNEELIDLLVVYDYKKWINFNINTNIPTGMIQTIAKFSDLEKLQKANTLILDVNTGYIPSNEYVRDSEPQPIGLGNSDYLYMYWKLI